jgi:hypothetical protein
LNDHGVPYSAYRTVADFGAPAGPDPADPGLLVFAALPLCGWAMLSREAVARRFGIA